MKPEDVYTRLEEFLIIDVRGPTEFYDDLGHIKGAKLLTLGQDLDKGLENLPRDRNLLVVCRSGGRSARAALTLLGAGFPKAFNLEGGMLRWDALGYEREGALSALEAKLWRVSDFIQESRWHSWTRSSTVPVSA